MFSLKIKYSLSTLRQRGDIKKNVIELSCEILNFDLLENNLTEYASVNDFFAHLNPERECLCPLMMGAPACLSINDWSASVAIP